MLTKIYISHSAFSKCGYFRGRRRRLDAITIGAFLIVAWVSFGFSSYITKGIILTAPTEKKRRLGLGVMKSMLIWIVAWMFIFPYLMGEDASILLTLSPEFWGYFASGIIGWYLGVWFGPKRVGLNI